MPPKAAIAAAPPAQESAAGASLWQKWAAPAAYTLGGALFAGAAAGAAYYKREDLGVGAMWVTDHLKYVGNLWNKDELETRLDNILRIESRQRVLFQTFFTCLPANPPNFPRSRTFAVLPHPNTPLGTHFAPNHNSLAADEIQAHTGMFDSKTNDGYYELGLNSARLIREAVLLHRAVEAASHQPPATLQEVKQASDAVYSSAPTEVARAAEAAPAAVPITTAAIASSSSVESAIPPGAVEQESEEEDDDDEEKEDEEKEGEAKLVQAAPKKDVQPTQAEDDNEEEEDDEEEEDEDDDEDEDEDEEEDDDEDEDEDEEEDDDDDEDEDEEAESKPPAKKA